MPSDDSPSSLKLTRTDLLSILGGMNISIPQTTKLKTDRIRHRLERALDAAQRYTNIFGDDSAVVDPTTYPPFDESRDLAERLYRKIWGGLVNEIEPDWDEAYRAFARVCQFIVGVGEQRKNKENEIVFTDEKACAIVLRVLSVHAVNEHRPLLLIGYAVLASTPRTSISKVIKDFFVVKKKKSVPVVRTIRVEQALLLHLLLQNKKHLSPEFKPPSRMDKRYSCTFLLPTASLNMHDIARLNKTTGCVVCGNSTRNLCDGCKSVEYCSKDCQVSHWSEHRPLCRTVSSGTWHRITLDPHPTAKWSKAASMTINRYDDIDEDPTLEKAENRNKVPPNLYADNYHLVKLQVPLFCDGPLHMFLFDRQKSFQLFFRPESNMMAFKEAIGAMSPAPQMYRWARRVSDWEWMICFDRAPAQTPRW